MQVLTFQYFGCLMPIPQRIVMKALLMKFCVWALDTLSDSGHRRERGNQDRK